MDIYVQGIYEVRYLNCSCKFFCVCTLS